MTPQFDVLVLGEICVDIILSGDVTPAFGQVEKLLDDAVLTAGSSSAIFACGAARLGLRVAFAGMVGDDVFGRFMLNALAQRGVDTSGVVVNPAQKTGLTVHLIRGADRAMLTHMGAMELFSQRDVDRALLHNARHVHVGSYFLQKGLRPDVARIFAEAQGHGLSTSLDTGYDPDETWADDVHATLAATTIFLPNATEALAMTGAADTGGALGAAGAARARRRHQAGSGAARVHVPAARHTAPPHCPCAWSTRRAPVIPSTQALSTGTSTAGRWRSRCSLPRHAAHYRRRARVERTRSQPWPKRARLSQHKRITL